MQFLHGHLGTGGTRFGRFGGGGEPGNLEEKIEDVGLLHSLNKSSGAISLHIPWDIPDNATHIKSVAALHGIRFDAMNSNTFQDQKDQKFSYKYGSMQHVNKAVRKQAIEHNIEVIKYGTEIGSNALTVWLSDGSCFPGQLNFRNAFQNTLESLQEVYAALPAIGKCLLNTKLLNLIFIQQRWVTGGNRCFLQPNWEESIYISRSRTSSCQMPILNRS